MNTRNRLLRASPPVMYRWLRRRHYLVHAAILFACVILFLPLGVVGGAKLSDVITTNKALAATRALAPEHSVFDNMSARERADYAHALSGLVFDDPETVYQLIGHDFLVMFREPDLKRHDGSTSIWQYRTDSCVLDVFFNGQDNGPAVHYEIRQRKMAAFGAEGQHEGTVDTINCLRAIYDRRSI